MSEGCRLVAVAGPLSEAPRWEAGKRGWYRFGCGAVTWGRIAMVTEPGVRPIVYRWTFEGGARPSGECAGNGSAANVVRVAKRRVESMYRRYLSSAAPVEPTLPSAPRRLPWWKTTPPRPAIGENCVRCGRWNSRLARKCTQCGVATTWTFADNLARRLSVSKPSAERTASE